jgi:cytochrome c5
VRAREGAGIRNELDMMFNKLRDGDTPSMLIDGSSTSAVALSKKITLGAAKRTVKKCGARRTNPTKGGVVKKRKSLKASKRILKAACKVCHLHVIIVHPKVC